MIKKSFLLIASLLVFSAWSGAQHTMQHTHKLNPYFKGIELLQKEKYADAQQYFEKALDELNNTNSELSARAQFYRALCSIKLFNEDAEYLTCTFIAENTGDPLVNQAYFQLGNYFHALRKYRDAIKYYEKVNKTKLNKTDEAEYYFKLGYSYFSREDLEKARLAFYQIKDINTKYTSPAIYYYAHINYSQKNYQTALEEFSRLTDDQHFSEIAPYYITQIYYLQEKYDDVIRFAPAFLEKVSEKRLAEVARIIGEAYYMKGDYTEAIPYLEKYMANAGFVNKEDKYQLGYACYRSGKIDKAIEMFENVSSDNSLLGQSALYHLADCYLKRDDKKRARMAFSSASKMDFDESIKKDALFNYAMVTYELSLSPFNEAIRAFNKYIELYPESPRIDEAYHFLVMAYSNTKNYKLALESIERISEKPAEIKKAYQKIACYRGIELYNNLMFREATAMFQRSLRYGNIDKKLTALSHYWKGEAHYQLAEYDKAIACYNEFLKTSPSVISNEYKLTRYNIAYAFFKQKDYKKATEWFRKYTGLMQDANTKTTADALNRIGDCFFVQSNYYSAVDFYDRSLESGLSDPDYALFQKGFSLGLINKDDQKIDVLIDLLTRYPGSSFADDATFEIGESYMKLQEQNQAIPYYSKVISEYPNSNYVSNALVQLGLIYYNTNQYNRSLEMYKKVISDYKGSEEAQNALVGIKNIFVERNNVDEYFNYVNNLGGESTITTTEKDSLSYLAAEKLYMSGDCEKSATGFLNYIRNFPEGSFLLNAHFYKGDCNYQMEQYDEALKSFNYIISRPKNMFTVQALIGAGRISYSAKDYDKALDCYRQLENMADSRSNKLEARRGIMRCYYYLEKWDDAIEASRKVLYTDKVSEAEEREARFILAKSLYAQDRLVLAQEEFREISEELKTKEGAESKFRVAEIYFKRGEPDKAEKEIYDFVEKTTPHEYWMAKSFILWSDIFMKRDDEFQAIQTLQSIIDYYEVSDDGILDQAKQKRKRIVARQEADEKMVEEPDMEINLDDEGI